MNSTTTSSSSVVYSLSDEVNRVSIYIWPVIIVLIVLTNTINIAVLSRRSLRSSSCTHYFLALAIDNLIYMCFTPMNIFLGNRFGLSINGSPFGCRIHQFFIYSSALFMTTMLVGTSIDRFFASSSSAWVRSFSSVRIARRVIIVVSILIIIYMSPFIVISYWDYNTNRCSQYSTTITVVYLSSRIVVYYIIEPLTMALFGLLTIHNIRSQTRRVGALAAQNRRNRTENQLTQVLIIQIGIHLIFSLPTAVTYIMTTFTPSLVTPLLTGVRSLSIIWQQGTFFLSFFLYILSASVFRREFLRMCNLNNANKRIVPHYRLAQRQVLPTNITDTRV